MLKASYKFVVKQSRGRIPKDTFYISCRYELSQCPPVPELHHLQNKSFLLSTAETSYMLRSASENIPPLHDCSMHICIYTYIYTEQSKLSTKSENTMDTHSSLPISYPSPEPYGPEGFKGLALKQFHCS